mgnify:CR=1 FL=1
MEAEGKKPLDRKRVLIILLLLVSLGIGGWLFLKQDGFRFDSAAEDGSLDGLTKEQIQELMNDKVDKSMLAISINSTPVFKNGTSKGTLRIENAPNNRYNMKVRITLDQDSREIYRSDAIRPAQVIKEDRLDVELKKGTYPCTATFEAYDTKTNEKAGEASAKLNIRIKE